MRADILPARYSTDHEWVKFDPSNNEGTVGITDYAQKALGDVVFVELPQSGTELEQGGTFFISFFPVLPILLILGRRVE